MKRCLFYLILLLILFLAGFLRLYRIEDYMSFLGDEGRDALIVKRLIVDRKFTLLGPITSVGLMHLGPIYYYFMSPFLFFANLDPVGPAIMVALFSLGTIILIFKFGKDYFGIKTGLIAALLYSLSPLTIIHAHSSWNPNILPFWAMLIIFGLTKIVTGKKELWFLITGLSLGIVWQLHYIALVFAPIILLILLLNKSKTQIKDWIVLFFGWLLTFLPFLVFEIRHKFINTLTIIQFITRTGDSKSFTIFTFFNRFWDLSVRLFWRLIVIDNAELSILFMFLVLGTTFFLLRKNLKSNKALQILFIWFFAGIGLLSFYTGSIYDYYLMFAFPLPFLLTAISFSYLSKINLAGKLFSVITLIVIIYFQLKVTPVSKEPNRLRTQTKEVAEFILNQTQNRPFNFALLTKSNSDHAYRYYLEILGNSPVVVENEVKDPERKSVTDQLFIVCEEEICRPLGHPLWEIAGFGRAEIANQWQVGLFQIFKLVHYKE